MKPLERCLIAELLKNSRRSDRELAKAIGVSQPTVSRMLAKLGKSGFSGNTLLFQISTSSDITFAH